MWKHDIDAWVISSARLWFETGWDEEHGGFFEHLKQDGTPNHGENRRVRVQFRQIFSLSFLQHHGYIDDAQSRLREALDYVCDRVWQADGRDGFPHVISDTGDVVDARRDMYDHAFALLAFAWAYRVEKSDDILKTLKKVRGFVEGELRHPSGSGFLESVAAESPRRQNPHMHSFEAYLAIYFATNDRSALEQAIKIFTLFNRHFWDREAGVLREYFTDDWNSIESLHVWDTIEPGHMVLWVSLLRAYQKATGTDVDDICSLLFANSVRLGLDEKTLCLWDVVAPDGTVKVLRQRLWPQTELIKAGVAQAKAGDEQALSICAGAVRAVFQRYLNCEVRGGWRDQFDSEGNSLKALMPASTHYHLLLALHEARTSQALMSFMDRQDA